MAFVTLTVFDNIAEASVIKSILESEGFEIYIFDEQIVNLNPLMNQATGGIKLKINEVYLENAKLFLNNFENKPLTNRNNQIIHCPNCNSTSIDNNFKNIYNTKGILSFLISIAFIVYPIYFKRMHKCKDCGKTFNYNTDN